MTRLAIFAVLALFAGAAMAGPYRQKDLQQADLLESLVRRVYHDFETLNYVDLRTIMHPDISLCVKARYDLGCYEGIEAVISYVSLIQFEVVELLRLFVMTPEKTNHLAVYTDVFDNAAATTARWEFFSFPAYKNVTLHMHDSFVFTDDNKLIEYTSWGAADEWADALIPPVSDYNATRICSGGAHANTGFLTGIQSVCTGVNQVYTSDADCISWISALPQEAALGFGYGDSIGCRDWHLGLARFNPTIHCPHVSKSGGNKCTNTPDFSM